MRLNPLAGHQDPATAQESHAADPADQEARQQRARRLLDQGEHGAAEALYRQLLAAGCASPSAMINLAALCQLRGALDEADQLLSRALELDPGAPLAWFNRGVVLTLLGDSTAAVACYRRCLELPPGQARAAFNLGLLLHGQGELAAAEQAFRTALALNPHDPETHSNLAGVLLEQGQQPEAIACCRAALALQPDHAGAHSNLAAAQLQRGDLAAAIQSCREAIRLQPEAVAARDTLANALLERGEIDEALNQFQQALALKPDFAQGHYNLGNAHLRQRDPARAIASYEAALRLRPGYHEARWNLALSLLLRGDYRRGWELFDAPACLEALPVRRPHATPGCPLWQGQAPPPGEPLLLVSEQGLGDTLQFVRYLPLLAARGPRLALCTEEKLHGLLAASGIGVPLLTPDEGDAVNEGHWLRLLSLPRLLGVTPQQPLATAPYLRSSDALIHRWREILAAEKRPILGVHWQGNPDVEVGGLKGRSLALEQLAPLAATGVGSLLSLQRGRGSEQLEGCSFRHRFVEVQERLSAVVDFLELAAILEHCDLVITTDTAMAHLAGASGRPTWLLLHHQAEWRWGLNGSTTPWYPSLRLFRQRTPGDWSGVIEAVAAELPGWARDANLPQPPPLPAMAGPSDTAVASRAVQLCDGSQVLVPDSLECFSTYVLLEQHDWFEDELRFLRRFLRPGQVVIDIGANVGVYSLSLARCVGPGGAVWAFEPATEPAALLARSIELNATPWVRLQRQALSDHSGSGWLHQPGRSELNTLVATPAGPTVTAGEAVEITTLDACLDQHGWSRVDLLKIDAEGQEERILNGGQRFFATLAPLVLFEIKAGETLHLELIERFARLGYRCFRLVPGLDALLPFDGSDSVDGYLLNLFAVPADRVPALIEAEILIDPEQASPPAPGAGELEPAASQCLAGWEAAHDPSRPLSARYGALRGAFRELQGQCGPQAPASRWASLARLALELGERQQAVVAAQQLLEALSRPPAEGTPAQAWLEEPFLPPHPAMDGLDPTGREQQWLLAAALTTVELAGAYSSYFTGASSLPRLRKIHELGFPCPEISRRLELVQRRFAPFADGGPDQPGQKPAGPEPAAPAGAPAPASDALQASAGWGGGYYTGFTYGCYSFGELAPNWLDFALLSQRQRPPRSGGEGSPFRYLELGSGMGLGLCLLAAAYPEGTFVGIDFHPNHIAHSRWLTAELGLANVSFHEADFLELAAPGAALPFAAGAGFHYAAAHGILSWIGPAVREALLQLAGRLLRPGGAFYCSYNTYPGWLDRSAFKALADLERQRLGSANLPLALQRAGSSLERLLRSASALSQALPQLAAHLRRINQNKSPDYLCGEFGAEHWQPFYVGQVHQLAAAHKLSYAASASLPDNFPSLLPAPLAQQLAAEADPTIRQALLDLAIHQSFRRDLFVKGPLPLSRPAQEQQLAQLLLRGTGPAGGETPGGAAGQPLRIDTNLGLMGDEAGRLRQLTELLAQGPACLAELQQALAIPPEELVLLTSLLLHGARVGLDRGAAGAAAQAGCRAVNARLIALMQGGHNLGYVAAPAIGHGAQAFSLIDAFVLDGLRQGLEGEVLSGCVLLGLQATGVELRDREGAPLNEPAACLERLETHITAFRQATLPRLVQLGIVDPLA